MKPRVAINGFGRIGRNFFRGQLQNDQVEIVAINDLGDLNTMAHLLKYDSVYRILDAEINVKDENTLTVNGKDIKFVQERDPANLPWKDLEIDIVIESTGIFTNHEGASKHLEAGAKKVIISAPGKDLDRTIVMGVNENTYNSETDHLLSNASCTTNCLAPIAKVIHEKFNLQKGLMTTIHAYTGDQRLLDFPHKDLRRARAAALSMIPTTTGAAKAVSEVLPELNGKLNGLAIRVPIPTVSIVDLVCTVEKNTSTEEINQVLKEAAAAPLQGILAVEDKPLVSVDFTGNPHSSIVDAASTMVLEENLVKIMSWYDNEWGYSLRLGDLCQHITKK